VLTYPRKDTHPIGADWGQALNVLSSLVGFRYELPVKRGEVLLLVSAIAWTKVAYLVDWQPVRSYVSDEYFSIQMAFFGWTVCAVIWWKFYGRDRWR
jgi:hypothetical protein